MTDAPSISAINKVLHEELESRARIEVCRHEAEKIIENGRHHARRISNRADDWIGVVQARTDLGVAMRLAEVKRKIPALSGEPTPIEQTAPRLLAAIEELTNDLVGDVE